MRPATCLPLLLLLLAATACRKHKPSANANCPVPTRVMEYRLQNGIEALNYNGDGHLSGITWFNKGQLGLVIKATDTVVLDSLGRLLHYMQPFNTTGRQTAEYFYDGQDQVIRTVTHTGNGIDYLQHLTYRDGDVVAMSYQRGFSGPSDAFGYRFYDTLSPYQFMATQSWSQIGLTQNRHLLKASWDKFDTTYYSYVLDSNKRVIAMYRDYDNTGWVYARAIDTIYYRYSCD